MADLDFFVDVVVSGAVLGVGLIDSPDGVAHAIGTDFVEDRGRAVMRRDYGLVEFFWARRSGSDPWHATGFTVHVHRLASLDVAREPSCRVCCPPLMTSSEPALTPSRLVDIRCPCSTPAETCTDSTKPRYAYPAMRKTWSMLLNGIWTTSRMNGSPTN
ncbi:hypothetical protein ENC19_06780 [Verrucosispora sp. CWR15]|uniref:Uncharacterized protein n=1 Tax=Verrucosispora sioxanthis TaxID=2499994 RepID=A0A6M1KY14_9ACTN|nr:hypothetical protein [Verrucosispora sioxanthis]NEE63282.1 hypothetical protein [Verrucosispora sioxanthis]NGM12392.1 hypothetical protein [Verrucosispora sioxanthis]